MYRVENTIPECVRPFGTFAYSMYAVAWRMSGVQGYV